MEDHLRQQIHLRNANIERLQQQIREKDELISKLRATQNLQSNLPVPDNATLLDDMRNEIKNEMETKLNSKHKRETQELKNKVQKLSEQLQQTQSNLNQSESFSANKLDASTKEKIEELQLNLSNTRMNFKDAIQRCAVLQQEVDQLQSEGHKFYLQRLSELSINEPQLRGAMPTNQSPNRNIPHSPGVLSKKSPRRASPARRGRNGSPNRGGRRPQEQAGKHIKVPPAKYPPGSFPLAFMTPDGLPIITFVPLKATSEDVKKLLEKEMHETLLRIKGKQQLFGYPYGCKVTSNDQLVSINDGEPILQSSFVKEYRTNKQIAILSIGEPGIITRSLFSPRGTPKAKQERKWQQSSSEPRTKDLTNANSLSHSSQALASPNSPRTLTKAPESRNRASTEFTPTIPRSLGRNPLFSGSRGDSRLKEFQQLNIGLPKKNKPASAIQIIIVVDETTHVIYFPASANVETMIKIILHKIYPEESETQRTTKALRFTLKVTGTSYFLTGGEISLHEFPIVKFCQKKNLTPMLSLVSKEQSKHDKIVSKIIGTILTESCPDNFSLNWQNMADNDISDFRIKMSRILGDHEVIYAPQLIAETEAPPPNQNRSALLAVRVYLENANEVDFEHFRVTLQISGSTTASELLPLVCKKFATAMKRSFDAKQFALKVAGESCYIPYDSILYHLTYVQSCIKKKKNVYFVLIPKNSVLCLNKTLSDSEKKSALDINTPFDSATVDVFGDTETVSLLELKSPFEFKVISVDNISSIVKKSELNLYSFYITAGIYFGGERIPANDKTQMTTKNLSSSSDGNVYWRQWLRSSIRLCDLPEDSRLCITLWSKASSSSAVANVNCSLFDFKDHFRTGNVSLRMWCEGEANPIGTCMENLRAQSDTVPTLVLSFHTFPLNVAYPHLQPLVAHENLLQHPSTTDAGRLQILVNSDPLHILSENDKILLWKYREWLRKFSDPRALVKVLQCVKWYCVTSVREIYRLLSCWKPIDPVDALQLLDAQFANRKVREFAVRCLDTLSDQELRDYLLQLVQALKYEPKHFSPLAVWLLNRSLQNPMLLGIQFFWMLKAELHVPEIAERYALLLEMYLRGCGDQRDDLFKQTQVVSMLNQVAISIKSVPSSRRKQELQNRLAKLNLPETFQLPLDPKRSASGLVIEKCKSMDSAKAPLWLVFKNADPRGSDIWLIFKSGDDLRQDLLTLQMLGIMDKIWKKENLDLCLTPYKCVATGDEMGMIETVLDSTTTAAIQKAAGGVTGALKQTPLANWLRKYNPGDLYNEAVQNFTRSCAGYCVATYVLGIGDRHNDNIMVNQHGFLFHIDFGHFLGHYKTIVLNVRRERAPFVLTPEFANVMGCQGSENFNQFIQLCCDGYNIIRRHGNVFINLFAMMLSTGIPELQSEEDIQYIRKALQMDKTEDGAAKHFTKLIKESIDSMSTQLMFVTHIMAHRK